VTPDHNSYYGDEDGSPGDTPDTADAPTYDSYCATALPREPPATGRSLPPASHAKLETAGHWANEARELLAPQAGFPVPVGQVGEVVPLPVELRWRSS